MKKKVSKAPPELHECPNDAHLVWWKVTQTAQCPWCVIKELKDNNRRITEEIQTIIDWLHDRDE